MQMIQIPEEEYRVLKEQIALLSDTALLKKVNKLIDLLYQEKYGLYMGDFTDDLTEHTVGRQWDGTDSGWDSFSSDKDGPH